LNLKLYTNSHSVSCSKVEFVLDFKSIEIDKVEAINNYGAFSPTATVPCLSIDGLMISDSGAILEFLEEEYPDPSLLSDQPNINSNIRFLAKLVDEKLVGSIRKLFSLVKTTSHPSDSLMIENIFKEIENHLQLINDVRKENKYLASNSVSLSDCNTPAFFSMLKEFEIHFNKQVVRPNTIKTYESMIEDHENLYKEYKRYGFEIRTWIANKLLA
tara:strand:+ start:715 stop:1359 length:645 start_codon:yes stop_codon:yes gene_type:complete